MRPSPQVRRFLLDSHSTRLISSLSQQFDFEIGPPNLRSYDVFFVYTPRDLRRGRSLCNSLRRLSPAPIFLLAPIKLPDEVCRALQESVDILLPPEIDPAIAAGHVASLVRCQHRYPLAPGEPVVAPLPLYQDDQLEIDLERHTVKVEDRVIRLTPTEFRFLALLVRHARELLTYREILNHVWGWGAADHRIVHTFAAQLRAKLGQAAPAILSTSMAVGIALRLPSRGPAVSSLQKLLRVSM